MRIILCVILAVVDAARIRSNSRDDVRDSEAGVTHYRNTLHNALTLSKVEGNHSTSLLHRKPPEEKAKAAAEAEFEASAEDFFDGTPQTPGLHKLPSTDEAVTDTEFEEMLAAAIAGMMAEEIAVAKAAHDKVFHHGYYRAVKAEKAAKAAAEATEKVMTNVSEKAKVLGREVVLKMLLEHAEMGTDATVSQLLDHIESQVKTYSKQVKAYVKEVVMKKKLLENSKKHPEIIGLEAFLVQVQATEALVRERKGRAFDNGATTRLLLELVRLMLKTMHFELLEKHENANIQRSFQPGIQREMSYKMKSEFGLHQFVGTITAMDAHLKDQINKLKEQIKAKEPVTARPLE